MKTLLLSLFSLIALMSLTGCDDSKPKSMTEGVELSEIEAYEKAIQEMEAEDAGGMEKINERKREAPAE